MQSLLDFFWSFATTLLPDTRSQPPTPTSSAYLQRRNDSSVLSTHRIDLHQRLASALDTDIYHDSASVGAPGEEPDIPLPPGPLPVEALARPTSIFLPAREAPQRCTYIEPTLHKPYDKRKAWNDLPGAAYVFELFLSGKMEEAEKWCKTVDPKMERMYISMALGCIQCLKGLMSFAEEDLLKAVNSNKQASSIASQHRKKPPSMSAALYKMASFSSADSTISHYSTMTPSELHAELVYAESLCMKSLLNIAFAGDLFAFAKEIVNVRSCIQNYHALGKYILHVDKISPDTVDPHLRSGTYLGLGLLNIVLSMMPQRLLSVIELFGFKGDRGKGLELLMDCGGWSTQSPEPEIYPSEEGIRRPLADLIIIVFHTLSPTFLADHVDLSLAEAMLKWNGSRYPNGPFHQILQGELEMKRARPAEAISALQPVAAMGASPFAGVRNLSHMATTETALALLAMGNVAEGEVCWRTLVKDATWSKAIYSYGLAVSLLALPGAEGSRAEEIRNLLKAVPGLKQRIGGKSIPMEKCVAYRSVWILEQPTLLLGDELPVIEFSYFMNAFEHSQPTDLVEKILPALRRCRRTPSLKNGKDSPEDREVVRRFLEGVCKRYAVFPTSWAMLSPACASLIKRKKTEFSKSARKDFEWILTPEVIKKATPSDWVIYWAHYELGALLLCMGEKKSAKKHFDSVLSGKQLLPPAGGRTGKYPMEAALNMRATSALEACK